MRRRFGSIFLATVLVISFFTTVLAQGPIKWSAPPQQYPSQWSSAPAPSNYSGNQYGYQDPNAYWYGYGGYQNWGPPQPGFSGNPYYYYGH
jgi:hypothetical protein